MSRGASSTREVRRREAERLEGLDGAGLAAVGESLWTEPPVWSARLFWTFAAGCILCLPALGAIWVITGDDLINESGAPPGFLAWILAILLLPLGLFVPALVLAVWRRSWLRLDSTGITRSGSWLLRKPPPAVYRWADCGKFRARAVPVSAGGSAIVVECLHADGPLVINDHYFGEPSDLVVILNAYRRVYRRSNAPVVSHIADQQAYSPAELRRREAQRLDGLTGSALRAELGDSTWTSSKARLKWALGIIGVLGVATVGFFAVTAVREDNPALWAGAGGSFALLGGLFAWYLFCFLNPPRVLLGAAGLTVQGARFLGLKTGVYRWEDCGPFTLHTITGEVDRVVARCQLRKGHLKFEDYFGNPYDLVTILNAYRSSYGSTDSL